MLLSLLLFGGLSFYLMYLGDMDCPTVYQQCASDEAPSNYSVVGSLLILVVLVITTIEICILLYKFYGVIRSGQLRIKSPVK